MFWLRKFFILLKTFVCRFQIIKSHGWRLCSNCCYFFDLQIKLRFLTALFRCYIRNLKQNWWKLRELKYFPQMWKIIRKKMKITGASKITLTLGMSTNLRFHHLKKKFFSFKFSGKFYKLCLALLVVAKSKTPLGFASPFFFYLCIF